MSFSDKHNFKTFTKSTPTSLLLCIGNISNHSSEKCRDSLTMAPLSCTKSTGLCTLFIHLYLLSNSVIISSKKMIPIPLLVFHLVQTTFDLFLPNFNLSMKI